MAVQPYKCEICGTPTQTNFGSAPPHYYCEAHRDELYTRVTGKTPKKTPEKSKK